MGRLVDDVLAMFGVKPSDRVRGQHSSWSFSSDSSETSSTDLANTPEAAEPQDCLSCRIIGTSAMASLGIYCVYIMNRNKMMYKGRKRIGYMAAGASLTASFFWMATCRAFDIGVFAKRKDDATLLDVFKQDIDSVVNLKDVFSKSKDSSE